MSKLYDINNNQPRDCHKTSDNETPFKSIHHTCVHVHEKYASYYSMYTCISTYSHYYGQDITHNIYMCVLMNMYIGMHAYACTHLLTQIYSTYQWYHTYKLTAYLYRAMMWWCECHSSPCDHFFIYISHYFILCYYSCVDGNKINKIKINQNIHSLRLCETDLIDHSVLQFSLFWATYLIAWTSFRTVIFSMYFKLQPYIRLFILILPSVSGCVTGTGKSGRVR